MVELFFLCFNLVGGINKQTLLRELDQVYAVFSKNAFIPFRDASTKNMILDANQLYLENFDKNDDKRINEVKKLFENGELKKIIESSNIVDIDFSSCIHYTTPFDDVISLKFHERTAPYFSYREFDIWEGIQNIEDSSKAIAATFIMRFLRFGGRKVIYKVVDPYHHKIRFKYDDEVYYFRVLPQILQHYWQNADMELKETLKLFERIKEILTTEELPSIASDDTAVLMEVEKIIMKKTYFDVYPY